MYYDLVWASALVLSELGLTVAPEDLGPLLEATAGKDTTEGDVYRPYLVCATYLDAKSNLAEGEGAKFRIEQRAAAYRTRQALLDTALGLTVPPGTETVTPTWAEQHSPNVVANIVF